MRPGFRRLARGRMVEGACAKLTLERPDNLNALDPSMIDALLEGAQAIEAASDIRVAILSGEGKAYCAGGDIVAWSRLPPREMWREWTRAGHRTFEALARLRVPLIVVLTGRAFGCGLEWVAVGDVQIAETGTKLGLPESGLGMTPGWSGTQGLMPRFGSSVVRRMALAGAMFSAEERLSLGLVDEVAATTPSTRRRWASTTSISTAAGGGQPLGNIQLLGRVTAPILKSSLSRAPEWALGLMSRRSVDWYPMSEDLPNPESRVTVQCGRIRLD